MNNLVEGLRMRRRWMMLAKIYQGRRFQRSLLGEHWDLLNYVLTVTALGYLFSVLFHRDFAEYWLYLAGGFAPWLFVSAALTEGSNVFVRNASFAREIPMPVSVYVWALVWKLVRISAFQIFVVAAVSIWIKSFSLALLPLCAGFVLVTISSFALILLFGVIGARFRDVIHFMPNILRGAFFLTPILWTLDRREELRWLVDYNPFFYLIEVVRAPLIGETIQAGAYLVAVVIALVGMLAAMLVYALAHRKLVYWL